MTEKRGRGRPRQLGYVPKGNHHHYPPDIGCKKSPSCLSCPEEECWLVLYDNRILAQRTKRNEHTFTR